MLTVSSYVTNGARIPVIRGLYSNTVLPSTTDTKAWSWQILGAIRAAARTGLLESHAKFFLR